MPRGSVQGVNQHSGSSSSWFAPAPAAAQPAARGSSAAAPSGAASLSTTAGRRNASGYDKRSQSSVFSAAEEKTTPRARSARSQNRHNPELLTGGDVGARAGFQGGKTAKDKTVSTQGLLGSTESFRTTPFQKATPSPEENAAARRAASMRAGQSPFANDMNDTTTEPTIFVQGGRGGDGKTPLRGARVNRRCSPTEEKSKSPEQTATHHTGRKAATARSGRDVSSQNTKNLIVDPSPWTPSSKSTYAQQQARMMSDQPFANEHNNDGAEVSLVYASSADTTGTRCMKGAPRAVTSKIKRSPPKSTALYTADKHKPAPTPTKSVRDKLRTPFASAENKDYAKCDLIYSTSQEIPGRQRPKSTRNGKGSSGSRNTILTQPPARKDRIQRDPTRR